MGGRKTKLSAMGRFVVGTFLVLHGAIGFAAPVTLDGRASGAAGTVAFRFVFDEPAKQASMVWSTGGGRPHAQWFGEAGSDNDRRSTSRRI